MNNTTVTEHRPTSYQLTTLFSLTVLVLLLGIGVYLMINGEIFADEAILSTSTPSPNIVPAGSN